MPCEPCSLSNWEFLPSLDLIKGTIGIYRQTDKPSRSYPALMDGSTNYFGSLLTSKSVLNFMKRQQLVVVLDRNIQTTREP